MWVTFSTMAVTTSFGSWTMFEVARDNSTVYTYVTPYDVHGVFTLQTPKILMSRNFVRPHDRAI